LSETDYLESGSITTEVAKRDELHKFKVIPKQWVVERSFAWLGLRKIDGYGKTVSVI